MKIRLTERGLGSMANELDDVASRLDRSPRPLLQDLGQRLATAMRANIQTGGTRLSGSGVTWPQLSLVTRFIRAFYGHGDDPLIRGGALLESIAADPARSTSVEAGSNLEYAGVLDDGGTVVRNGRDVKIPAFPFARPADSDLDQFEAAVLEFYVATP